MIKGVSWTQDKQLAISRQMAFRLTALEYILGNDIKSLLLFKRHYKCDEGMNNNRGNHQTAVAPAVFSHNLLEDRLLSRVHVLCIQSSVQYLVHQSIKSNSIQQGKAHHITEQSRTAQSRAEQSSYRTATEQLQNSNSTSQLNHSTALTR